MSKKRTRASRARRKKREMTYKMKRKSALLFTVIVLALLGVNIRLAYINKTSGDKYTKKVLAQQDSNSMILPYKRGDILDRNGTVLATSEKVYNLILDPRVLLENANEDPEKDCVTPTLKALTASFELQEGELRTILSERASSSYVPLIKELTKDEISAFEELMEDEKTGNKIKGVWFEDAYVRKYPYNSLACNVIGYVVAGNQGQTGIEQVYSDTLNGTNGRSYNYLNEDLEQAKSVRPAIDGNTVVSTIDFTLQQTVEKYIDKFIDDYTDKYVTGPAAKRIGVLMMNPQNGEVYAMAGDVDYDLNNPYDLVENGYMTEEEVSAMSEEEQLEPLNQMWRNFCISDGFEPGSTVKPMTVAGALDSGILDGTETFLCDGVKVVADHEIHCAKRAGHGIIDLEGAIMFSCNDALMQIAAMEGYEIYYKYQDVFNFGLKTNIDLPGEANNASSVYTVETTGPTQLATNSFGQGNNVTMIQVAAAFSSVINGGYYYKPHVVRQILDSNGSTVENIDATLVKQTISSKTSATLRQYLYSTMYGVADANGNLPSGRLARVAGYAMGGKTGTAQKLPRTDNKYLVSFIGFAPVDNPQVLCYVVIDEPNAADAKSQASSSYAQELFKNIMKEALPYLNIYPTEEIPEDMKEEAAADAAAGRATPSQAEGGEGEAGEEGEEGEEGNGEEDPIPEGSLVDPQTGETVQMPDPENIDEEAPYLGGAGDELLTKQIDTSLDDNLP